MECENSGEASNNFLTSMTTLLAYQKVKYSQCMSNSPTRTNSDAYYSRPRSRTYLLSQSSFRSRGSMLKSPPSPHISPKNIFQRATTKNTFSIRLNEIMGNIMQKENTLDDDLNAGDQRQLQHKIIKEQNLKRALGVFEIRFQKIQKNKIYKLKQIEAQLKEKIEDLRQKEYEEEFSTFFNVAHKTKYVILAAKLDPNDRNSKVKENKYEEELIENERRLDELQEEIRTLVTKISSGNSLISEYISSYNTKNERENKVEEQESEKKLIEYKSNIFNNLYRVKHHINKVWRKARRKLLREGLLKTERARGSPRALNKPASHYRLQRPFQLNPYLEANYSENNSRPATKFSKIKQHYDTTRENIKESLLKDARTLQQQSIEIEKESEGRMNRLHNKKCLSEIIKDSSKIIDRYGRVNNKGFQVVKWRDNKRLLEAYKTVAVRNTKAQIAKEYEEKKHSVNCINPVVKAIITNYRRKEFNDIEEKVNKNRIITKLNQTDIMRSQDSAQWRKINLFFNSSYHTRSSTSHAKRQTRPATVYKVLS